MSGALDLPFLEVDNAEELLAFVERQGNEVLRDAIILHDQETSLLHLAALQNKPRCTEALLERKANVNQRARGGRVKSPCMPPLCPALAAV